MIYNVNELRKDTIALIADINKQITAIHDMKKLPGVDPDFDPAFARDQHGTLIMPPLLLAKATAYNTLVMLQSGENRSAGRQRSRPQ